MKDKVLQSDEDKRVFVDAILNPPQPNSKLTKAKSNNEIRTKNN